VILISEFGIVISDLSGAIYRFVIERYKRQPIKPFAFYLNPNA